MEYIQIISNHQSTRDLHNFQPIFIQKLIDECQYCVVNQNDKYLEIISSITRMQDYSVPCRIQLKQHSYLSIKITFFEYQHIRFKTLHSKGIMLRQFLTLNNGVIKHFLHPNSGQFILVLNMNVSNILSLISKLIQTLSVMINKLIQYSIKQFKNIYRFFSNKQQPINYDQSRQLQRLKRIIKTSPFYGFTMLKSSTHSRRQKDQYQDLKKEFQQMNKYQKKNRFIELMSQILNYNNQIKPYNMFTKPQQLALKQKYIPRLQQNLKSLVINQITLSQLNLRRLFTQQLTKVQCHELGKIYVYLQFHPQSRIPALNYQRQVLSKLPKNQFTGILKYYFIKNYKDLTSNCVITNLTSGVRYYQFLQNNKTTISIFTKLHLIHQISITLKYLTNNGIVYHNLQNKNIYVKKGLYIKATDFTNAFHDQINVLNFKRQNLPWKSAPPYVSTYEYRINHNLGDQRSDIFSLGMIMYETIYGKTPLFVKNGKTQEYFWIQKLLTPLVIGIEKKNQQYDKIIQLITYLMLECIRHERIVKKNQKSDNSDQQKKLINMKSRPYLDWILISLKIIMQIYKKIYN